VEAGYSCTSSGACGLSTCEPMCGDGQRVGAEECDDGDTDADDECRGGNFSSFSILGKVLCVPELLYPSANVKNCDMPKTWKELSLEPGSHTTGGLGKFMILYQWEVWMCHTGVVCGGLEQHDDVCFTYSEEHGVFVPWGLRSEIDF
jgi:hypothetical protein